MRPAVFLDRDGTIIESVHYIGDPDKVRLIPRAAQAIRLMQSIGYACVVVTNQSAVGRGIITLDQLAAVNREMERQLADCKVRLDGIYFCTTVPTSADRSTVDDSDRKPGPGMLRRAAADLLLDLPASWMVGDMLSDALAGRNAGCNGSILVRTGDGKKTDAGHDAIDHVAEDLLEAAQFIARQTFPQFAKEGSLINE